MRTPRIVDTLLVAALAGVIPAAALAQSGETSSQASSATNAQGALQSNASAAGASAEAKAKAEAEAKAEMDAVLKRGAKQPAKARAEAEAKIHAQLEQVDEGAASEGETKVAERLGAEFGMTADALVTEKQSLGASWGELMIAHTLEASAQSGLTVEQIYQMRKEGSGWGQIAAGMGLKLGDVVSAVRAEARVATGLSKPDGKVHLANGVGAGVRGNAGVKTGGVGTSVKAGAGVDVNLKTGKP